MFATLAPPLTAPAFDVADLLIARAWAEFHDLIMTVRLDNGGAPVRAEEILVFTPVVADASLWRIWRDRETVVVQAASGRSRRFARLSDALAELIPETPPELTDLRPTARWP